MAQSSRRRSAVKEAIDDVLRRISGLPPSTEVEALRAQAEEYLREAGQWSSAQPPRQERELLMRHVLKLHVEVAKLERAKPST
jgi:hypothetical protein